MAIKPLGRKAYGSIGHLPCSCLGPGDHCIPAGQAKICTEKTRDKHDRVIVQEKLDGSYTAVAKVDGVLHPRGRAGWPAESSKYLQYRMFADWVWENEDRLHEVLCNGERIVGEWLAQAHGTLYDLNHWEPWAPFDIMTGAKRIPYDSLWERVAGLFHMPHLLHAGGAVSVETVMDRHETSRWPAKGPPGGVVYRVERKGEVDFLAKWVRPDKIDGKYLPEVSGGKVIWNWQPESERVKHGN